MRSAATALLGLVLCSTASAQEAPVTTSRAALPSGFKQVGSVARRSTADMRAAGIESPFSIGTETTDRGFSTFAYWRDWLGPLGIPNARLQTGWASIERKPGVFDFSQLDLMVRAMKGMGVQPWMDLAYGNPIYPGGGQAALSGGLPVRGTEGYERWKNYVRETVRHFATGDLKVVEWQIWNEPDGGPNSAGDYAALAIDTARIVKEVQPEARLLVGAFTGSVPGKHDDYALSVIRDFAARSGIAPGDVDIVVHPYNPNPDESYAGLERIREAASAAGYRLRQGENGTNSRRQPDFALRDFDWTETSQAKWALRRALGDVFFGMKTNLFTLVDLHYTQSKNNKGLLLTGEWSPEGPTHGDQRVQRPKVAYRAVQALATIVDSRLTPMKGAGCKVASGYTVQPYERKGGGRLLAIWRSKDRPGVDEKTDALDVNCTGFRFAGAARVYVDLIDASIYSLPRGLATADRGGVRLKALPVYDSPILVADAALVPRRNQ